MTTALRSAVQHLTSTNTTQLSAGRLYCVVCLTSYELLVHVYLSTGSMQTCRSSSSSFGMV
ncbi:hypothetical protein J6590_018668 [Homalodisca vitripennis]|nr:hypothetical protein J6590_018668 [Homalodisca vitripennis]